MTATLTPPASPESMSAPPRSRSHVARQVLSWVLMAGVVLGWAVFLRPQALGGRTAYIGVSGVSMTPTMRNGDLAVVRKQANYKVGDIVAYKIRPNERGAGSHVIHRIVGGDAVHGFVTKGDHNSYTDYFWHPRSEDVIGKVWFHVPAMAGMLGALHSPWVLAPLVAILTFAIIAWPSSKRES